MNNKNKLDKYSFVEVEKYDDPHGLKHFILSNYRTISNLFSLDDPFIFDGIVLGLCLKGTAKVKVNFKEYDLKTNSVVVMMPNQVITILDKSEDFFVELLCVSVDFIAGFPLPRNFEILFNIGHLSCMEVSSAIMEDLIEYHRMIVKQHDQVNQPYRTEIVQGLLYTMLLEIMGLYSIQEKSSEAPSSRLEEIANHFFELLRTHFKQERTVSFYADKLCITPKYLSSIIKKVTGATILSWIHESIIVESKMLLKTTDLTVLQISDELNFPNPSFFGKFFKEHTEMTPLEFREMN